jgi:hypothetical protein
MTADDGTGVTWGEIGYIATGVSSTFAPATRATSCTTWSAR